MRAGGFAVFLALSASAATVLAAPPATAPASPTASPPVSPTARPPLIVASAFTQTSGISDLALAPDGSLIALRAVAGGKVRIGLFDPATKAVVRLLNVPERNTLEWFAWAGSQRILISLSAMTNFDGNEIRISRLYVYDLGTQQLSFVGRRGMGFDGDDVLFTDPGGQYVLLQMQNSIYDYPSVWRFPLDGTGDNGGTMVQRAKNRVWYYDADVDGVIRTGFEYVGRNRMKIWYRRTPDADLEVIARLNDDTTEDEFVDVLRILGGSDEGFVLKRDDSGHVALRKYDFATRTAGETVYAAPGWDVTSVGFDESNHPLSATYTDDRDHIVWLDPAMARVQTRLERALPGKDIWVTSRARNGSRMMVWAGREDDPGVYYIYDAAGRSLEAFSNIMPGLDPQQLVTPQPVSYPARDGTTIHGYLTLPRGREARNLPLIVLPHGGPFGIRDQLNFSTEVQFLANRGYAVLQPNYRGSGGYGDAFEKLGEGQIGRTMQDDLDDGTDWLIGRGTVDAARVCMVGSSYGGYAALWAVIRNPEKYRCAASFAGVTDWKRELSYDARFLSRNGSRRNRKQVGGTDEEFDLDTVSPVQQIARLTRPVLLAHGDADTTVPFSQFRGLRTAAERAHKPIETLVFADEGHGFDKPEDQQRWLEALEAFLARNNPAD